MILTIIVFLLILGLLVLVHEFGHFIVAKKSGMQVDEFGVGFPPKLIGWKRGETEYTINAIPLGGFVRIKGETGQSRGEARSFTSQSAWRRLAVLVAGVGMNVILAWVLLTIGFSTGIPVSLEEKLPSGARVRGEGIRIVEVLEGSPALEQGIKMGATILQVNDQTFSDEASLHAYLTDHRDEPVTFLIDHRGMQKEVTVTADRMEGIEQPVLGIAFLKMGIVSYPFPRSIVEGAKGTVLTTAQIGYAFYDILKTAIFSQRVEVDLEGPVGIAVQTGDVARLGVPFLLHFAALLSLNLAIINILPLPALDGGRVLFLFIEQIRRRPMSMRAEGMANQVGFLFLIGVILLVTYRDIMNIVT